MVHERETKDTRMNAIQILTKRLLYNYWPQYLRARALLVHYVKFVIGLSAALSGT